MPPDEPTEEEQLNVNGPSPLQPADLSPSETDLPADPAVPHDGDLPDDHPATDTNMQPEEVYDEGVGGAAEVDDQSGQSAVTGLADDDSEEEAADDDLTNKAL